MRIMIVHYRPDGAGGAESAVADQAKALRDLGHEVEVVYRNVSQTWAKLRPDVVHFHTVHVGLGLGVLKWAQRAGVPHCMSLHDYWPFCLTGRMLLKHSDQNVDEVQSCAAVQGVCDGDCDHKPTSDKDKRLINGTPTVVFNRDSADIYRRNGIRVDAVIAHGIDTDFFRPDPKRRVDGSIVTVSAWPRFATKGMHVLRAALDKLSVEAKLVAGVTREQVRDELQCADIFVFPSCYQETWGLCLRPGQTIYLRDGIKAIENVIPGDLVLTHTGNYRKVTKLMHRHVESVNLASIRSHDMLSPIQLTPEHQILILRPPHRKFVSVRHHLKVGLEPRWLPAEKVQKGDFLVIPISRIGNSLDSVDLSSCTDVPVQNGKIASKFGHVSDQEVVTYRDVVRKTGLSYSTVSAVLGNYESYIESHYISAEIQSQVRAAAQKLDWHSIRRSIPRMIPLDFDFGLLLGYYIAEGSCGTNYCIEFSFHNDEKEYREEIRAILEPWGLKVTESYQSGKRARICTYNKALSQVLENLCGKGAANKRLPLEWALRNEEFAQGLLAGAWRGDGHLHNGNRKLGLSYCTISETLAKGMRRLLFGFGILASVHCADGYRYILTISGKQRAGFSKLILNGFSPPEGRQGQGFITWDDRIYMPVKEVTVEPYSGEVYNLEVEGDESYCIQGFVVHNCLTEAMACGCTCIASDLCGTRAQIWSGFTGALVPPGDPEALADALLFLLRSPETRRAMGKAAREWTVEKAGLERMGLAYQEFYGRLLDGKVSGEAHPVGVPVQATD